MRTVLLALIFGCLLVGGPAEALAQSAVQKFDVVSLKPCKNASPGDRNGWGEGRTSVSPGRVSMECRTIERLIRMAYLSYPNGMPLPLSAGTGFPIPPRQEGAPIKGIPAWINSERFTIDAKAEGPVRREMMLGPMMQALLQDRFKLKVHQETREVPVYELTVAKDGPKLQPSKEGSCIRFDINNPPLRPTASGQTPSQELCGTYRPSAKNDGIEVHGVAIADLCDQFSAWLDRDVIDKTGIMGVFDVHLELTPSDIGGGRGGGPDQPVATTPGDAVGALMAALKKMD